MERSQSTQRPTGIQPEALMLFLRVKYLHLLSEESSHYSSVPLIGPTSRVGHVLPNKKIIKHWLFSRTNCQYLGSYELFDYQFFTCRKLCCIAMMFFKVWHQRGSTLKFGYISGGKRICSALVRFRFPFALFPGCFPLFCCPRWSHLWLIFSSML